MIFSVSTVPGWTQDVQEQILRLDGDARVSAERGRSFVVATVLDQNQILRLEGIDAVDPVEE
jgi:hypothetical protein